MNNFKVGDVVVLNSNMSRKMTIENLDGNQARCVWIDPTQIVRRENFVVDCLSLFPTNPKESLASNNEGNILLG